VRSLCAELVSIRIEAVPGEGAVHVLRRVRIGGVVSFNRDLKDYSLDYPIGKAHATLRRVGFDFLQRNTSAILVTGLLVAC